MAKKRVWHAWRVKQLTELASNTSLTVDGIARRMGMRFRQVQSVITRYRIVRPDYKVAHFATLWHPSMLQRLRELAADPNLSTEEIAARLGLTSRQVGRAVGRFKIRRPDYYWARHTQVTTWRDPDRDAQLQRLFAEGLQISEIGQRMGFTKNTISGRAYRMGLTRKAAGYSTTLSRLAAINVFPEGADCCVYSIGDPGAPGFHFCGEPQERGPYCAKHAAICYIGKPPGDIEKLTYRPPIARAA